ncbi:MAG: hypothetical protein A3F54_00965 [Candidatus Kerfeldbacteria bacterium RIFCSPHIGHO2_12_FULL_48_17]|uniref:Uncharacterized protein n=1 Tax=Candidatus Kerfeldbacteria bacterium RIFCSPHIGHO2_12_FULL_48_17 TaxID=1798542 RepID=A0A1G2AY29_9BACT|nr:MAG: hypothetical protein A3F54_00965 [Candidatus Kerfeldbacteria bacterium RIFCSPHIGHO2_12_FULL_48_17]
MTAGRNRNTKYQNRFLLGLLAVAAIFIFTQPVFADVTLEVPLQGKETVEDLPEYIELMYNFALSAIGIVAMIMMMWGGFKWIAAAGSSSKIGDAKDSIYNAIIGLILALLSFSLLFIINPLLLRNANPTVKPPNIAGYDNLASVPKCTDIAPPNGECYLQPCAASTCDINSNGRQDVCRKSYCPGVDKEGGLVQTCQELPSGSGQFKCISEKGVSEACDNPKNDYAQCGNHKICVNGGCTDCQNQEYGTASGAKPCCEYLGLVNVNGRCFETLGFAGDSCTLDDECVSFICDTNQGVCIALPPGESCDVSEQCRLTKNDKENACVNGECCILNGTTTPDPAACCSKTVDSNNKCAN